MVVRDQAAAEDVVQEAMIKAYRGIGRFRTGESLRPWLMRIVRNEALNTARSRGRRQRLFDRAAAQLPTLPAIPSPETAAEHSEMQRELLAALDQLPSAQRDVLTHRYLLEMSERETADVLGIPPGTVKSRTARGLENLRAALESTEGAVR